MPKKIWPHSSQTQVQGGVDEPRSPRGTFQSQIFDNGGKSDVKDGENEEENPLPEVVVPTAAEFGFCRHRQWVPEFGFCLVG